MLNKSYVLATQYIYVFCMDPRKKGYYFHKHYHLTVQNKIKTQLHFKQNIILCNYMFRFVLNHHSYETFKTQQIFKVFAQYFSEISLIIFFKNIKTLMFCSTCKFSFFFFIICQLLRLDKNTLLLKLWSLTARKCVNRNVDQVLITDGQFCPIDENVTKNHLYAV
jgi:hypothetical protein